MEHTKGLIDRIMFNHYVKTGEKLKIQDIQNILIKMGYSYYTDERGIKKLRILRKIRPYYYRVKRELERKKKSRDKAIEILDNVYRDDVFPARLKSALLETLKGSITTEDYKYYRSLSKLSSNQNLY